MENNFVWLGGIVLLAIGAMVAQFIVNRRNKKRASTSSSMQ